MIAFRLQLAIVTADPYVGRELTRTTADIPLRKALVRQGVEFHVESVVSHWCPGEAVVRNLLDGRERPVTADTLVLATTNRACREPADSLDEMGVDYYLIGDCAAPRQAPFAFHEGRKLGLAL